MSKKNEEFSILMGRRVRNLRLKKGLTAEQMAEAADVSTQYIFDVERGKKCMGSDVLCRMAQVLGVSCDYLTSGKVWMDLDSDIAAHKLSQMAPIDRVIVAHILERTLELIKELGREETST